jgi:hypothetical protein
VTAEASGKLAEKSRTWAAEIRETTGTEPTGEQSTDPLSRPADPATEAARDAAEENPPL